ncbi:hypothetical protein [Limnovirga soli]|uniref:Uncharacterized protein n=1 Tax=Limnovirga soli TaxID=2656915 RepID=A0A8J8FEK9_9BACT|nr:hypothetical protein [Limnovirga soli]NNV54526.1 hypothetical protein [Limnovirga soli]
MNQSVSFTAYLRDEYSKNFDKLAGKSDAAIKQIDRDLAKLANTGKTAARSIEEIDKRIQLLSRVKKLTIDTSAIRHANDEIKSLGKEKAKLEGADTGSGGFLGLKQGTGFAIAAGITAIGFAIDKVGPKALEATAKYQKYQAVLANSFGSTIKAQSAMSDIVGFASKTPYQVDELTQAYVRLRNRGMSPTLDTLTQIGDLAASQGKDFLQVTEALLDAPQKQFIRLQEALGVDVQTLKGGKLKFTGLGQTKIIKDDPVEIQKTVLEFGKLNGIMGSMAAISKTTGGQVSNLEDNYDLLYKAIGDRFKPEIDSSIGSLNSFIGSIREFVEIPVEVKLQQQIDGLHALEIELTSSNTSQQRRKDILDEIQRDYPSVLDGIDKEAVNYDKLAGNINKVVDALQSKQIAESITKDNADLLSNFTMFDQRRKEMKAEMSAIIGQVSDPRLLQPERTFENKANLAQRILEDRFKAGTNRAGDDKLLSRLKQSKVLSQNAEDFVKFNAEKVAGVQKQIADGQKIYSDLLGGNTNDAGNKINELKAKLAQAKTKDEKVAIQQQIDALGGGSKVTGGTNTGSTGSGVKSDPSISGSSRITNLQINIQSLLSGGVNIYSASVKEGASKMKDHVIEALVTSVNDANLAVAN